MTIEERLDALEKSQQIIADNLSGLINMVSKLRINTDADIDGARQSVANITPTVITEKAYYGETEKVFYDVPMGNTSVFFSNYNGSYSVSRVSNRLVVLFDTLSEPTDITISIQ